MITKHIAKVREKPEAERKKIAFFWALAGTLVIAAIWFFNLDFILSREAPVAEITPKGEMLQSEKPKESLLAQVSSLPFKLKEAASTVKLGAGEASSELKEIFK